MTQNVFVEYLLHVADPVVSMHLMIAKDMSVGRITLDGELIAASVIRRHFKDTDDARVAQLELMKVLISQMKDRTLRKSLWRATIAQVRAGR